MKKTLIIIVTILLASTVGCGQNSEGPQGPFGEQGEQGKQGEVGFTGSQGSQGEQGDRGSTGPSLKVVDAYGALVGYPMLLQRDPYQVVDDLLVFDSNVKKLIRYDFSTAKAKIPVRDSLSFTSTDCTGTPFVGAINNQHMIFKFSGNNKIYTPHGNSELFTGFSHSISSSLKLDEDGNLMCTSRVADTQYAARVYPIVLPSYSGQLTLVIE